MEGLIKLKSGDFNNRYDEEQVDGFRIITLTKRGESKVYKFQVKDLYGENEEVLWEEITERS